MIRLLPLFILVCCFSACGSAATTDPEQAQWDSINHPRVQAEVPVPADAIFLTKSCYIHFDIAGSLENGKCKMIFDDFGKKVYYSFDVITIAGPEKYSYVWKDGKAYKVDGKDFSVAPLSERPVMMSPPRVATLTEAERTEEGFVRLPDEEIEGKTCEVWKNKSGDIQYWIWKNIELKTVNSALGQLSAFTRTATMISDTQSPPPEMFNLPD
jgi:hypothetical protein